MLKHFRHIFVITVDFLTFGKMTFIWLKNFPLAFLGNKKVPHNKANFSHRNF